MAEPEKQKPKKITLNPMLSDEEARAVAKETLKRLVLDPVVGDRMRDGSIYAGLSPDTNKPMYVTSADASVLMDFNGAAQYAKKLDMHGHKDWRVPTKAELNVLFENREKGALKGTFNLMGGGASCYWSSAAHLDIFAAGQTFSIGEWVNFFNTAPLSVRCVRYGGGQSGGDRGLAA